MFQEVPGFPFIREAVGASIRLSPSFFYFLPHLSMIEINAFTIRAGFLAGIKKSSPLKL